jgi:hypothetical protein
MADDTNDTDQIERDLAKTRARMDRRLDELGERLAPNQLVNDALVHVTGGDGAEFAQTLIAKAKANPLPAVAAGIGIAWLMASSRQANVDHGKHDLPTRLRSAEAGVVQLHDEHPDVHASRLDDARGQVLGIARSASDTSVSYAQRIKDAMASARQSLEKTSHDLQNATSDTLTRLGDSAGHGGQRPGTRKGMLAGNPVVLGAAAALIGLVAGVLIPISDEEEKALGGFATQLRGKGRNLAQEVVNRGASVAGDALGAVKDSAQAHGLTADKPVGEVFGDIKSGALLDHIKQGAQEVANTSKESMRSQLGTATDERA